MKQNLVKPIRRLLVANRGEIAIRIFRASTEHGIQTIALYSKEDRLALHRFKADEAYLIGAGKSPVDAYLDIEGIVNLALEKKVDAIHPGYGFLSESSKFAKACEENGILFIGPSPEALQKMGDKVYARALAKKLGIPVIPGTDQPIKKIEEALQFAKTHGFPVILKAAHGGGGRGMRIVRKEEELKQQLERAKSESLKAFGSQDIFLERYMEEIRHIEIQILADNQGNTVHLFERDCSIQRRHQKVIEIAPSLNLDQNLKETLYREAKVLAQSVNYTGVGTVEFVINSQGHYFIEMNTRLQVEHTITECITGIDLVQAQIHVAQGFPLSSEEIGIPNQDSIQKNGYAIQCRVTTEDPANYFIPDSGRISAYRTAAGMGIRLDGACTGSGHRVTLDYDSLLVKIIAFASNFKKAVAKMDRSLREFRIRGVKTNIHFLGNLIHHPSFLKGECKTSFIEDHPELFEWPVRKDRATKILSFLGDITVNGSKDVGKITKGKNFFEPPIPKLNYQVPLQAGTKNLFDSMGAQNFSKWILEQKELLFTDTTLRDAHQSLIATRMRTYDMLKIVQSTSRLLPELFSHEMWGGATFDVSYRFLKEDPWQRLFELRKAIPNVLFQMLLRGANAVGYTVYPDNLVQKFIQLASESGIDLFRIFDSLNWLPNMKIAIEETLKCGKLCEPAICYTGDILDPSRSKYDLKYYIRLAKELEQMGAHILGIKDMAGLCKPLASYELISALKQEISIPIHFHTHDTSSNGLASLLKAAEAGVDIVDTAIGSMSGLTSQPNMGSLVSALSSHSRKSRLKNESIQKISAFWELTREYYYPFESGLKSGSDDVYQHEIPGGQYSNLRRQASEMGLGNRWTELKHMYQTVNRELGDLIKVTPSSKMVSDFALFLMKHQIGFEEMYHSKGKNLDFPQSVYDFFKGILGQPYGGFPEKLQKIVLKKEKPLSDRAGKTLKPIDFTTTKKQIEEQLDLSLEERDLVSYHLYPNVVLEYFTHKKHYGDISVLPSKVFFYGLEIGEETSVEIEEGKSLIIELQAIGNLQKGGTRELYFELNGQPRVVSIQDRHAQVKVITHEKADRNNPYHVAAPMPGKILKLNVKVGNQVKVGESLLVMEAMKMENNIAAKNDGNVSQILHYEGAQVDTGDLLLVLS